ncbi:DUF1460 domain-containing protein [Burkholderia metallica]|uniref:DUF1460 domain-containing protein n=1 Tax=Burkholderia metallica TaxID=488729 RepID=UPI001575DC19|nr:DUF1460 domain-containing protein [Burkholderia metallica]NTZ06305.1 DUF1460 domain-containing protein [Burkholderia metallica]
MNLRCVLRSNPGKAFSVMLLVALSGCGGDGSDSPQGGPGTIVNDQRVVTLTMNAYTSARLDALLAERATHASDDTGQMIERMSGALLGTAYRDDTLIGSPTTPEQLVIDLQGVDCFTYLDYVDALRKSSTRAAFIRNLIDTRYINDHVGFLQRKHFFTDWAYRPPQNAVDVTASVSMRAETVRKILNRKSNGGTYVPGVPPIERPITFIPAGFVDAYVVSQLRTGDFIGIYATADGLDVTHVGIFVMTERGPMLRNASSLEKNRRVVDSPFLEYVARTPGIIVLRPQSS